MRARTLPKRHRVTTESGWWFNIVRHDGWWFRYLCFQQGFKEETTVWILAGELTTGICSHFVYFPRMISAARPAFETQIKSRAPDPTEGRDLWHNHKHAVSHFKDTRQSEVRSASTSSSFTARTWKCSRWLVWVLVSVLLMFFCFHDFLYGGRCTFPWMTMS